MKKIFFAVLAVSLMSASFTYAGKGKREKKKATKMECAKDCPRMGCNKK